MREFVCRLAKCVTNLNHIFRNNYPIPCLNNIKSLFKTFITIHFNFWIKFPIMYVNTFSRFISDKREMFGTKIKFLKVCATYMTFLRSDINVPYTEIEVFNGIFRIEIKISVRLQNSNSIQNIQLNSVTIRFDIRG